MLITEPKDVQVKEEKSRVGYPICLCLGDKCGIEPEVILSVYEGAFQIVENPGESQVLFYKKASLEEQEYEIYINEDDITVFSADAQGIFYALGLLWQMYCENKGEILCRGRIKDGPDLKNRGFMMDISRGKVPKLETLKHLADILARCRYNQLQLYIEGYAFCYPSFRNFCREEAALTPDEIRELDAYCAGRFIELVPNQNTLGHMAPWLAQREFSGLAESENGFSFGGFSLPPTTLDPANPETLSFVERLTDDLLCCFTSRKIHVGLDEAFELGHGKNAGKNLGEVFLSYLKKLNEMVKAKGHQMMMWADSLHRFDSIAENLPDDVIYMEWGYEKEYPFEKRCAQLAEAGKNFYVCPGTSSWTSFTGLTDNMLENVDCAVKAAVRFGAEGILLTDWGDNCHMQYLPVSYGAVLYCAMRAWNADRTAQEADLANALDVFVFNDRKNIMGQLVLDAGRYYGQEEFKLPCRTLAAVIYADGIKNRQALRQTLLFLDRTVKVLTPPEVSEAYVMEKADMDMSRIKKTLSFLCELRERIVGAEPECDDAVLVKEELLNGIRMAEAFTEYRGTILSGNSNGKSDSLLREAAQKHRELWLARNKISGLNMGVEKLLFFLEEKG